MANNFEDILDKSFEDIKDIPPIPPGNYLARIDGEYEPVTSQQKQTPGYQISFRLLQAREDIDRESLEAALNGRNLTDIVLKYTFWQSAFMEVAMRNFFQNVLKFNNPKMKLKAALAEMPGHQLYVTLAQRSYTPANGVARLRTDVTEFAAAE